jgi:hypothetical protein
MQSLFISLNTALAVAGNMITAALVKRIGKYCLLSFSFVLLACGIGIAAFASHLVMIFLALCIIGWLRGSGLFRLWGLSIEQVHDSVRAYTKWVCTRRFMRFRYVLEYLDQRKITGNVIGIPATLGFNAVLCLLLGVFGTYKLLITSN